MSDGPSFLGSLRNLLAQQDPTKPETGVASFRDFLCDPGVANEPPTDLPPVGEDAFDENSFFWAMRNLPIAEATKHFLICGCIGSGKTVTIQLFLQSIARRFRRTWKKPEQLILFDAKNDALDLLKAIGLESDSMQTKKGAGAEVAEAAKESKPNPKAADVWILNPADPNSAVWNVAEAVQSPMMARHLATLMVPEERNSNSPYFTDGARELIYAVLLGLCSVAGVRWTFRDLLCALESQDRIVAVASQNKRAGTLAARLLGDERHTPGILSTLGTKLGRFEQVAALWHARSAKAPRLFSIREFLARPGVLILGNDPVLRDSFWPINAMLLKALTQEILREPDTLEPRHWFVLDEFRAMENVQCIHDLLNRGRSKGASVLIGLQSIDGLMEIYRENGANDILSQCASKTFLRAGGPVTAEWAARFFGQIRCKETVVSESTHGFATSISIQHNITERSLFVASYFMNLALPHPGGDYAAVCDVPCLGHFFIVNRSFDEVLSWRNQGNKPPDKPVVKPATSPCEEVFPSPLDETLQPWTEVETAFFCKDQTAEAAPKKASQAPAPPPENNDGPAPSASTNAAEENSQLQTKERFNARRNPPKDPSGPQT